MKKFFEKKIFSTFVFFIRKKKRSFYISRYNRIEIFCFFFFLRIVDRETLYSKNIDFVDFICNLHGYMYM